MSASVKVFRTSGDVRLESAKWAKADVDQVAVTNPVFMSTRPKSVVIGIASAVPVFCCVVWIVSDQGSEAANLEAGATLCGASAGA
jgi:NO-binding membrane sensor protein with MHYT domain